MEIRRATPRDADGILRLLHQVAEVHHKGRPDLFRSGRTKYTKRELLEIIADPKSPVLVAVDASGTAIGHAFCAFQVLGGERVLREHKTLYIDDICVDEARRRQGVGAALCGAALSLARENGCYNVTLNVWKLNAPAERFYAALGFLPQKTTMEKLL